MMLNYIILYKDLGYKLVKKVLYNINSHSVSKYRAKSLTYTGTSHPSPLLMYLQYTSDCMVYTDYALYSSTTNIEFKKFLFKIGHNFRVIPWGLGAQRETAAGFYTLNALPLTVQPTTSAGF